MKKKYLVFNINNCVEDYVAVSRFVDLLSSEQKEIEVPMVLKEKVYVLYTDEENKREKLISLIAQGLREGNIEKCEDIIKREQRDDFKCGCLRVAHEADDATIEYIYLAALLYKFSNYICFLYSDGEEQEKYAIWNKAVDFFFGFSAVNRTYEERIFGEQYDIRDNFWSIKQLDTRKEKQWHSKVNPMIELNDNADEIPFWRTSIRQHNIKEERYQKVIERCQKNFIEEYKRTSKRRENYYQTIYDSEVFKRDTEDMPLLAYYLFCMQIFYSKKGKELNEAEIRTIRLNAWDIADGILQLIENIHHTTEKIGFMDIRVHENKPDKGYLNKRYGISDTVEFYYEIRLVDISKENIVESFQRQLAEHEKKIKMRIAHFFTAKHEKEVEQFWEKYNQDEENLVHHYGLQVFGTIVSANEGVFKVVSSSKYDVDRDKEEYINREEWNSDDVGSAHMPGTEYTILIPLKELQPKVVTSVETNAEYQYAAQNGFKVKAYGTIEDKRVFNYWEQEKKESLINYLAEQFCNRTKQLASEIEKSQKLVVLISIKDWNIYPLEIYSKAIILCGIRYRKKEGKEFYCIIHDCENNQILEMSRLFSIFYSKAYLCKYLTRMQIYLSGENEELQITGGNLNSLYTITSKIMLVKGINRKTADIMKYLIRQYGLSDTQIENNNEKIELVPFDMLELPDVGMTLFEKQVYRTLTTDIQNYSLGCKIKDTHMRIGSKLHMETFFEAELLFHNNYYISRFAELVLRRIPLSQDKKIIFVGYETYSELLLYKMVMELLERKVEKDHPYQASYMLYEQRIGGRFRYMDEDCLTSERELQFVIVIPINSTLTTHNKVRNSLEEELDKRGILKGGPPEIIANYALILVRSSKGENLDEIEETFWEKIEGRTIKTSLIPEGEPNVEFFVCVNAEWHSPLRCRACFPSDYTKERPLVETDRTSIVPVQMLGINEPELISYDDVESNKQKKENNEQNLERIKALKESLVYRHVVRNGNHYLYYFRLGHYFIQERENIIAWLKAEQSKIPKVDDRIVYDIIVSPLHYSNAGFLAEVNHYLFDNAALVLNFEVEKEFRENVKTKYSNIIGLYYNICQMGKKALIRFHFVDDSIISGRTFSRAKNLFRSLIHPMGDEVQIEVFSNVVVLLNRMSSDSIQNLTDGRLERFHAYANLHISSMRNHEDACTECKLVTNYKKLRNQSSTNQQYRFWNSKIKQHIPIEIQNKRQEELIVEEERRERTYKRMLCTHLANERFSRLGYEKNNKDKVRQVMIELMAEERDDQIEWIISYVKVFSRPFISFLKSNREAVFQIMLWMIEYVVKELPKKKKAIPNQYREIRRICSYIRDEWEKSENEIYNLLLILMNRLSDLGSNYIIRKENMICLLKLNISEGFVDDYIGIIKRICCQSSDESKSIFLEYLLLCGDEYIQLTSKKEQEALSGESLKILDVPKNEVFCWRVFLENTRVLLDGLHDITKDVEKSIEKGSQQTCGQKRNWDEILGKYYYENFRKLLYLYGYWDLKEECLTEEGEDVLETFRELNCYLEGEGRDAGKNENETHEEKDAEVYYKNFLNILAKLTSADRCCLLYGTAVDNSETMQYYRMQTDGYVEVLKNSDVNLRLKDIIADTYVMPFEESEYGREIKRTIIKYDIHLGEEEESNPADAIFLQLDFPKSFTKKKIMIFLKMIMIFHDAILQHLRRDFTNSMIQKWSAREYFNKQMMLQRATDHTDRDNLKEYYDQILNLHKEKEEQTDVQTRVERDRALFHMVINSYIARMNIQILAGANPEREPSHATFERVYKRQLEPLIESLHQVHNFCILDEYEQEGFSKSLLNPKVKLRRTEVGESISFRRISVIIIELILSAINHSVDSQIPKVYIYREDEYLVVKNRFKSKKDLRTLKNDINSSVARKKDGISLATIKGIVNTCYDLQEREGVQIDVEIKERKKYFCVKLPILYLQEDWRCRS